LGGFSTVDFTASREIRSDMEVFFGVQNIFNKEFVVQTNPRTIGAPRLVNVGFRLKLAAR
jgi:outer membrane receptor protein involved in Fe transport